MIVDEEKKSFLFSLEISKFEKFTLFVQDNQFKEIEKKFQAHISANFFSKYLILETLGRGKYSEVFKVLSYDTKEIFALKVMSKEGLSESELRILENEFRIMEVMRHKNIIKFFEKAVTKTKYEYIMEFIQGNDLMDYVMVNGPFQEEIASQIMKELIETMIYIHKSGIIHRDLKPENILIHIEKNKIKSLKIIDFGLSCYETEL